MFSDLDRSDILNAITALISSDNVVIDQPIVEAGLAVLKAGGDFADGVIAFDGFKLGAEEFVSFDKKAIKLTHVHGKLARLI